MKFIESYNKIVNAYIKDQIEPYNSCFCFVGNLLNNISGWGTTRSSENYEFLDNDLKSSREQRKSYHIYRIKEESKGFYNSDDITRLEYNFLNTIEQEDKKETESEEGIYRAMESTLMLLKQIHEEKGEIVEEYNFSKRELIPV